MYHLPPRKEGTDKKRTVMQLLHYITEEHLGDLKAGGLIAEEKFLAGETVLSTNQVADSIYVIQRGVVRQDYDIEDPQNARMSPAGTRADAERKQVQLCARCCALCGRARVWHMCSSICAHLN